MHGEIHVEYTICSIFYLRVCGPLNLIVVFSKHGGFIIDLFFVFQLTNYKLLPNKTPTTL